MTRATAQGGDAPRIDNDDIGGVVTSTKGPEAGVWVIAETTDLPTKMARIVVTDDRGRYVIPDLPKGNYSVWVRGYGLVDSAKSDECAWPDGEPDGTLSAQPARRGRVLPGELLVRAGAAARQERVPRHRRKRERHFRSDAQPGGSGSTTSRHPRARRATRWATRRRARCRQNLGKFGTSVEAWNHRLQAGIDGGAGMYANTNRFGRDRVLKMFADWTDRIAGGEIPQAPPRPQGVERNFVVTVWDWATRSRVFPRRGGERQAQSDGQCQRAGLRRAREQLGQHDDPGSDAAQVHAGEDPGARREARSRSRPRSASPRRTGARRSTGRAESSDTATSWTRRDALGTPRVPARPPRSRPSARRARRIRRPSCSRSTTADGSTRFTTRTTKQWTIVDTCFGTFHLNFAHDANNTIWSGNGGVVGWVNTKVLDETQRPAEGTGLGAAHSRHQRQRQAGCVGGAGRCSRSDQGQADRHELLRDRGEPGPTDAVWGDANEMPGAVVRVVARIESANDDARGDLRSAVPDRCQDSTCISLAAWTSTATASSGPCWPAGTTPASIGASARPR